jgi:hypothetical protein
VLRCTSFKIEHKETGKIGAFDANTPRERVLPLTHDLLSPKQLQSRNNAALHSKHNRVPTAAHTAATSPRGDAVASTRASKGVGGHRKNMLPYQEMLIPAVQEAKMTVRTITVTIPEMLFLQLEAGHAHLPSL